MSSFWKKYSACREYVNAMEDLPPTYDITNKAGTCPIPDPDFHNKTIFDAKWERVEIAEKNMKELCKK